MGVEPLETSEASQDVKDRCPDPNDCTVNNGGGVYTEELGSVGIGSNSYLASRFVNEGSGSGVTVQGRGYDPYSGNFYAHPATILYVRLSTDPGVKYTLMSVSESGTAPTFVLDGPNGLVKLTNEQILDAQLVFQIDTTGLLTLSFVEHHHETIDKVVLQNFHAVWNVGEGYDSSTAQEYCLRAPVTDESGQMT